jgi:hypothetical protein
MVLLSKTVRRNMVLNMRIAANIAIKRMRKYDKNQLKEKAA